MSYSIKPIRISQIDIGIVALDREDGPDRRPTHLFVEIRGTLLFVFIFPSILNQEFERLTARLGELERAEQDLGQGKKTIEIAIEQDREIKRIIEKVAAPRHADLEAREAALRTAVLSAGAKALEELLQGIGSGRENRPIL